MRRIGLIGGMSWVSTGMYYDRINRIVQRRAAPMASAPMLIDSLDSWVGNLLQEHESNPRDALESLVQDSLVKIINVCGQSSALIVMVSSEVGLSLVPPEPLGRRFQDLLGSVNQRMAATATEVYLVVREAVERARAGEGPTLIEAMTYRWGQHSMRANLRDPRPKEEFDKWMERDPIARMEEMLVSDKVVTEKRIAEIGNNVDSELATAVEFGTSSPQPTVQIMEGAVYAPHIQHEEPGIKGVTRELHYNEALNEAMHQEMDRDERVILMGEDVAETGGIFQVSKGLFESFGGDRVRDTPISEATFVGCGVGAAVAGMRPIVEIQIFDFVALTMDMIVNQAAKFRYMLGGGPNVPLVVRGPQGGGIRLAAQHSQSLEAWFTHIPGLVVLAPSTPYDAKGLLTAAIRDDNPVIFLEQKLLYLGQPAPVPESPYAIPIGKADIKCEGSDVTVVATSAMVPRAIGAAQQLQHEGISVEVVDPRTLKPLDEDVILNSVRKTNRLLIVHEACRKGGFGAEVAATVVEKAFDYLDAPIARLGAPDAPIPYNDELERYAIPSQDRIVEELRELLK